jgi:DNA modification methylase
LNDFEVLEGDVFELLPMLPDNHVQCVITSPPYWGLRKYGDDPREIGSEKTFAEYVARIAAVFEEVRRILRPDGTLWLNMGDSWASRGNGGGPGKQRSNKGSLIGPKKAIGFKLKDLIGQPWSVAFALREAGWYLRQEIIWFKRNPMPESCKDRPTRAHEQIFLMSKSQRYYYDFEAIKEPGNGSTERRTQQPNFENQTGGPKDSGQGNRSHRKVLENLSKRSKAASEYPASALRDENRRRIGKEGKNSGFHVSHQPGRENSKPPKSFGSRGGDDHGQGGRLYDPNGVEKRNKRSVWELATSPFPEAHYAIFPPALVLPCILAGSRPGDLVMDPFSGAGTVGKVALERGRKYLGIELYHKNSEITDRRIAKTQPGLPL